MAVAELGALSQIVQGRAGDMLRDIDRLLGICAAASGAAAPPTSNSKPAAISARSY